jgi:hypothetical protein
MSYNIIGVAKDLVTGNLDIADKETANARLAVCVSCEVNVLKICTACNCVIPIKVQLQKASCPLELW